MAREAELRETWKNAKKENNRKSDDRFLGGFRDSLSHLWHGITGTPTSAEKRDQKSMIKEQIDAYKKQTEIAEKQIAETRAEKDIQKRKVNEKQIRSLRNNYRPSGGFLNNQGLSAGSNSAVQSGLSNKLGA
jgi:hypothetical protein